MNNSVVTSSSSCSVESLSHVPVYSVMLLITAQDIPILHEAAVSPEFCCNDNDDDDDDDN